MYTSAIIFVIFTIVTLVISESHDFELYAFEQPLDHFNSEDNRTWNQIYYINDDFYIPGGPVFIYLDAPAFLVEPVPLTTILTGSRFTDIAEKSSGRIISIQSRFYGLSQPTEDTSILNLQHYNIQETLADFANFIRELRNNEEDPIKIFLFGEDIGASYAVWTKKIYPDIIDGVIAYGPRLEAKIEFPEFYAIVGATIDVGENVICGEIFTNAMEQLSELVDAEEGDRIQEIFGLSNSLDTNDVKGVQWFRSFVFNYFSYIFVYQRYLDQITFCEALQSKLTEETTDLEALGLFYREELASEQTNDLIVYSNFVDLLKDESWDSFAAVSSDRQTLYRSCNEYSWFLTSTLLQGSHGDDFPLSLFISLCQDVFGLQFTEGHTRSRNEYTNIVFGGAQPVVSNVYISYGEFDPYRLVGPEQDLSPSSLVEFGLYSPKRFDIESYSEEDDEPTKAAKIKVEEIILQWLAN